MKRNGISLMEVLFAVGAMAIGLFGVIALYPLGLRQMGQGTVADSSFRVGQDATQEFEIRGMGRFDRWLFANQTTAVGNPTGTAVAFAIDPRFVTRHGATVQGSITPAAFPYWDSSVIAGPRLSRITLATASFPGVTRAMSAAEADAVFALNDELVFDLPDDKLFPPAQQFGGLAGAPKVKRLSEGTISWMATLAPKIDATGSFKDLYLLSIVVFNRRDPAFFLYEDLNTDGQYNAGEPRNERIVDVSNMYASGFGGGEIELRSPNAIDLDTKAGDWLMLTKFLTPTTPMFRWYRVVEAEEELRDSATPPNNPPSVSPFFQDVTLQGGDWPPDPPGVSPPLTKAVLIKGVVAVYERTIRLETSGIFSP
ncbi:MAG: hypothetical protein CMJ64_07575 [Planctomycetaceae bacterium]|nr:hypothetical protein [Planctomycetaceae bacterium]